MFEIYGIVDKHMLIARDTTTDYYFEVEIEKDKEGSLKAIPHLDTVSPYVVDRFEKFNCPVFLLWEAKKTIPNVEELAGLALEAVEAHSAEIAEAIYAKIQEDYGPIDFIEEDDNPAKERWIPYAHIGRRAVIFRHKEKGVFLKANYRSPSEA